MSYRSVYDFDARKAQVENVRSRYPDFIPIIVESDDIKLKKQKFLVSKSAIVNNLRFAILKNIEQLDMSKAIFLFVWTKNRDTIMLSQNECILDLHTKYREDCGYLFVQVRLESAFGS